MQLTFTMKKVDILKVLFLLITLDLSHSKGSGQAAYRAKRYGSYYKSTYYSYSGVGFARYSRVYSTVSNAYAHYYSFMFTWMNTDAFTVYKNTPSDSISVCKNYEANDNGTYMGVFTCPLPFVPEGYAYCCGLKNAEYCCRFWDVPLNVAAVTVASMMGVGLFCITVYIFVQLCKQKRKTDAEKRERTLKRRFAKVNRSITLAHIWNFRLNRGSTKDLIDDDGASTSSSSVTDVKAYDHASVQKGTS